MYIRCALFEGNVKLGQEKAFHDFVTRNLLPLWTKFPGATDVRVLSQKEADTDDPHYAMVLAIQYPDMVAIERAMQSAERAKSRELTVELVKMFDGRIFHTIFDVRHNVTV